MVCPVKSGSVGRDTLDPKKERRKISLPTFDTVLVKEKKKQKKKNALGYGKLKEFPTS
jgi:hypothetical protein